jgi:cellulose synthase/poly-beta-1,6-N-acetylglucosamine synthase-like glycosyltransferase
MPHEISLVISLVSLIILAAVLLGPAVVFMVECLAARVDAGPAPPDGSPPPRVAILIPAHDEEGQIAATVVPLAAELREGDRLVVIADNCHDGTASVVRGLRDEGRLPGVSVVERRDPARVGKGFAISFGVEHLAADPPDVVVLVDADCRVTPGAIGELARAARRTDGPVQGEYLLASRPGASALSRISALALLVRNRVRPRGLARLGLPCLLTGSGMAFPWSVLRNAPETRGNIVEDMVLGLELALAGCPPRLCMSAQISSELPTGSRAAHRQRRRWEHGQLHTLVQFLPRLLGAGLARRNAGLLGLAADLSVPPLALLVILQVTLFLASLAPLAFGGGWLRAVPLALSIAGLAATALGVAVAWSRFGRAVVPASVLLLVPFYVVWKVPLYGLLLLKGKQRTWERTARPGEGSERGSP